MRQPHCSYESTISNIMKYRWIQSSHSRIRGESCGQDISPRYSAKPMTPRYEAHNRQGAAEKHGGIKSPKEIQGRQSSEKCFARGRELYRPCPWGRPCTWHQLLRLEARLGLLIRAVRILGLSAVVTSAPIKPIN